MLGVSCEYPMNLDASYKLGKSGQSMKQSSSEANTTSVTTNAQTLRNTGQNNIPMFGASMNAVMKSINDENTYNMFSELQLEMKPVKVMPGKKTKKSSLQNRGSIQSIGSSKPQTPFGERSINTSHN